MLGPTPIRCGRTDMAPHRERNPHHNVMPAEAGTQVTGGLGYGRWVDRTLQAERPMVGVLVMGGALGPRLRGDDACGERAVSHDALSFLVGRSALGG
jgi:hypothetical protein